MTKTKLREMMELISQGWNKKMETTETSNTFYLSLPLPPSLPLFLYLSHTYTHTVFISSQHIFSPGLHISCPEVLQTLKSNTTSTYKVWISCFLISPRNS